MEKIENTDILKELFDDKIIRIINVFLSHPTRQFYLSEISNISKVNVSSVFRILNKLSSKGFVKTTIIGKIRFYQLNRNEKTRALMEFLKKSSTDPLDKFIDRIKAYPRIKKIILETKKEKEAKILIVGDYFPESKLNKIIKEIKDKYNFKIHFVRISGDQFKGLTSFKNYSLNNKIIWERKKSD
jgi:DNA-binding MarR family transcriptional regulator